MCLTKKRSLFVPASLGAASPESWGFCGVGEYSLCWKQICVREFEVWGASGCPSLQVCATKESRPSPNYQQLGQRQHCLVSYIDGTSQTKAFFFFFSPCGLLSLLCLRHQPPLRVKGSWCLSEGLQDRQHVSLVAVSVCVWGKREGVAVRVAETPGFQPSSFAVRSVYGSVTPGEDGLHVSFHLFIYLFGHIWFNAKSLFST